MPSIDKLLQLASPTPYMGTIDVQAEYWQVPVAEEVKDKTCFTICFGTFRFKRMPLDLPV